MIFCSIMSSSWMWLKRIYLQRKKIQIWVLCLNEIKHSFYCRMYPFLKNKLHILQGVEKPIMLMTFILYCYGRFLKDPYKVARNDKHLQLMFDIWWTLYWKQLLFLHENGKALKSWDMKVFQWNYWLGFKIDYSIVWVR